MIDLEREERRNIEEQQRIDEERCHQLMFQQQQQAQQQTNAILQHSMNVNKANNKISSVTSFILASTTAISFPPTLDVPVPFSTKDCPIIN